MDIKLIEFKKKIRGCCLKIFLQSQNKSETDKAYDTCVFFV